MKVTFVLFVAVFGVALAAELHASKIMQAVMGTANYRAKRSFGDPTELAFLQMDSNGDRRVSLDELIGFVKTTTGMAVNGSIREGFVTVFQREDKDNNRFLDRNEFGDFLQMAMHGMRGMY